MAAAAKAPSEAAPAGGLHHFVVQWIGNAVAAGRMPAGTKITPEELAADLGVSRTVIREALRVLQAKGMVRARPRTGTRVCPVQEWNVLDPEIIGWRVHGRDRDAQLRELMDLRGAIEPSAARIAAAASSAADAVALRDICALMEQASGTGDLAAYTTHDIAFHTRLLVASGNLIYRQFAGPVEAVLRARESLHLMPDEVGGAALARHRDVGAAIEAGDGPRAERIARELVDGARAEIFAVLERGD